MNDTDWRKELAREIIIPIVKQCICELIIQSTEYLLYRRGVNYEQYSNFDLRKSKKRNDYIYRRQQAPDRERPSRRVRKLHDNYVSYIK